MNKTAIALKLLKSPLGRKLAVNALKNRKVRDAVIKQAGKQMGKRLFGK